MNSHKWERLPQESSKQFEAFTLYRDLGPNRSIQKVAQERTEGRPHTSRLKEWSFKYEWVERATAYDAHLDEIRRSGKEDEIRELAAQNSHEIDKMNIRHALEAQLLQNKAIEKLESLNIEDMKPHDIVKFYDTAVKIERLSRGVSTENIKREEVKEVKEDDITREKLQDPQVRKRATEFIKAIADSQSSTNRVSTDSQ